MKLKKDKGEVELILHIGLLIIAVGLMIIFHSAIKDTISSLITDTEEKIVELVEPEESKPVIIQSVEI